MYDLLVLGRQSRRGDHPESVLIGSDGLRQRYEPTLPDYPFR